MKFEEQLVAVQAQTTGDSGSTLLIFQVLSKSLSSSLFAFWIQLAFKLLLI